MDLQIENSQFNNINEIWIIGSHCVEVYTQNHNHYKIIAKENVWSGTTASFSASYEKLETLNINNVSKEIWVRDVSLPWANGDTVEECIKAGMGWVNQQR